VPLGEEKQLKRHDAMPKNEMQDMLLAAATISEPGTRKVARQDAHQRGALAPGRVTRHLPTRP